MGFITLGEDISQGINVKEVHKEKGIPVHNISSAEVKKAVNSVVKNVVSGKKSSQEISLC